jgi:hypothetical protein
LARPASEIGQSKEQPVRNGFIPAFKGIQTQLFKRLQAEFPFILLTSPIMLGITTIY